MSYQLEKTQQRARARRIALARPWPFKVYSYIGWLTSDYDNDWTPAIIFGVLVAHVALVILLINILFWIASIGGGWILWLALGSGTALGLRAVVAAATSYDRKYRE